MLTSPSSVATAVAANYFDGRSSAPIAVMLAADEDVLVLQSPGQELRWPLSELEISERLGNTPRFVSCAGQGHCEVTDHARFDALLQEFGVKKGWLDWMQHSLPWAAAALLVMVVLFGVGYRYALPWAAAELAARTPDSVLQQVSNPTLQLLEGRVLFPSTLSAERQQAVVSSFARLMPETAGVPHYQILFRRSEKMGANAFALPSGTIVVLDDLVALAQDDNEVSAVLAHELGHVQRRHGMRMLLQSSIVGLFLTWYIGDASWVLAGAPAMLLQAKFSRDMEREADEYAAQALQQNGLSSCLLAGMLDKLEKSYREKEHKNAQAREGGSNGEAGEVAAEFLSTHPATRERIQSMCPAS
jgi:Zn-dependent protease with chaperone function